MRSKRKYQHREEGDKKITAGTLSSLGEEKPPQRAKSIKSQGQD
jgi:hypothetical protein